MTVENISRRAGPFIGDGTVTAFPFEFKVFNETQIAVHVADGDNPETVLTLNEDYTVALNEDQNQKPGGTVTLLVPLGNEKRLAIISVVAATQTMRSTNYDRFYPETYNNAFDKATILIQQLVEQVSRAIVIAPTDTRKPGEVLADIMAIGELAEEILSFATDIKNVSAISDQVIITSQNVAAITNVSDNLESLLNIEETIQYVKLVKQYADEATAAAAKAEEAAKALDEIAVLLPKLEESLAASVAFVELTDTYPLQLLATTARDMTEFSENALRWFVDWFDTGISRLQHLSALSTLDRKDIRYQIGIFNQWFADGLRDLSHASDISAQSNQFTQRQLDRFDQWFADGKNALTGLASDCEGMAKKVELLTGAFDRDIQFRNLQLRTYVEKPYLLWIVAGQSNAKGTLHGKKGTESATHCALYWDWSKQDNKSLKPLADPVYECTTGSAWPSFARTVFALTGRKSIVLNVAYGGAAVTSASTNTWYGDESEKRVVATREFNALKEKLTTDGISYELAGVLWIQGEAEGGMLYRNQVTVDEYVAGTKDVFSFFRTLTEKPTLPVFVSVIGDDSRVALVPAWEDAWEQIRQAQRDLPSSDSNVHVAFGGAQGFLKAKMMNDPIHYSQKGYNLLGQGMARYVSNFMKL